MKIYLDSIADYHPWAGAKDTFSAIESAGKLDALEMLIEDVYPEGLGVTGLNDLLWFDSEWVYAALGMPDPDADDEDDEDEDSDE